MVVFAYLLLAHLLGDFILQPKSWVAGKEAKKIRSPVLYAHVLIHGALVLFFLRSWPMALTIALSHGMIDLLKLYSQSELTRRAWFGYDQALHVLVIAVITAVETGTGLDALRSWISGNIVAITGVVLLTTPASMAIRTFISRWSEDIDSGETDDLSRAGKYIGILERLFVYVFVMSGQWNAIGFLIAAKSVFRFGDLKEARDRKLTEYILIGTLLSIGIATLVALAVKRFGG